MWQLLLVDLEPHVSVSLMILFSYDIVLVILTVVL